MPYQSLNPIVAEVTSGDQFQPVELEIFIEKISVLDTYTSLGIFTFTSNSDDEVNEQIQNILHTAMMLDIKNTIPNQDIAAAIVPELARKFKYSSRFYNGTVWSAWEDSTPDFVVLGGLAYEEFQNTFNAASATAPYFLHFPGLLFTPKTAAGWVYVLSQKAGTLSYTFQFYNLDGTEASTVTDTIDTDRDFTVVKIPIAYPPTDKKNFYLLTVTVDSVTVNRELVTDFESRPQNYDICYLSSRGGWAFINCHGSMSRTLDITSEVSEKDSPADYFSQNDISQFDVFNVIGNKKISVATGHWPKSYLEIVTQDFLLSRKKIIWNATLQKWLPIMVPKKSVEYKTDNGRNLMSFQFDFEYAFQTNIPSSI